MPRAAEDAYAELIRRTREASVLASCGGLLSWDESTYMPRQGSAFRGEQMGLLARLTHEMTTAPAVGELLAAVESSALVADAESAGVVVPPEGGAVRTGVVLGTS